jgi:acyl carrier protein
MAVSTIEAVSSNAESRAKIEGRLATIWCELLKVREIDPEDDLFDCGATSLMIMSAVNNIHRAFGVELELLVIFQNPTMRQLAAKIEAAGGSIDDAETASPNVAAGGKRASILGSLFRRTLRS